MNGKIGKIIKSALFLFLIANMLTSFAAELPTPPQPPKEPVFNFPQGRPAIEQPIVDPEKGAECGNGVCEIGERGSCDDDCPLVTGGQGPLGNAPNQPLRWPESQLQGFDAVPGGILTVIGVVVIIVAIAGFFIYTSRKQ